MNYDNWRQTIPEQYHWDSICDHVDNLEPKELLSQMQLQAPKLYDRLIEEWRARYKNFKFNERHGT